jgi:hypothetical protein
LYGSTKLPFTHSCAQNQVYLFYLLQNCVYQGRRFQPDAIDFCKGSPALKDNFLLEFIDNKELQQAFDALRFDNKKKETLLLHEISQEELVEVLIKPMLANTDYFQDGTFLQYVIQNCPDLEDYFVGQFSSLEIQMRSIYAIMIAGKYQITKDNVLESIKLFNENSDEQNLNVGKKIEKKAN